jgi:hypothetical protein
MDPMSSGDHRPAGDGGAGGGGPQAGRVQDDAGDATGLGRQLQAAAGGHVEGVELDHRRRQGRTAQPLLQRPQAVGRTPGGGDDKAGRVEAEGGEARGVQVELGLTPEDRPVGGQAAGQGGAEAEGGAVIHRPRHLMQAAAGEAAAEMPVERRQTEGKRGRGAAVSIQRLKFRTQLFELY